MTPSVPWEYSLHIARAKFVFVVDDDPSTRTGLARLVRAAGHKIRTLDVLDTAVRSKATAYDAKHYGLTLPVEAIMTTQERAYTSPIWYTP